MAQNTNIKVWKEYKYVIIYKKYERFVCPFRKKEYFCSNSKTLQKAYESINKLRLVPEIYREHGYKESRTKEFSHE